MNKTTFFKRSALILLCFNCFGLHAITFPFRTEDVAAFKKFFQQPSAVPGKINAEVVGIDINRPGFSWDDMNTWANSEGKVFHDGSADNFVKMVWGASFSTAAPYNGGLSRLGWTRRTADGIDCKPVAEGGQGKDVEEKWTSYTPGIENLSGELDIVTNAGVVHVSDTRIQKIRIQMHFPQDSYMHASRNQQLTHLDLSGSTAPIRQLAAYRNLFSELDAIKTENMRTDGKLFDWLTNIAENSFRFSTMPVKPDGTLYGGHNSKQREFGVGEQAPDGTWEIKAGEFIDLTEEYDIRSGNITTFVWKNEDGDVVTPSMSRDGFFRFTNEFIGSELTCEMSNKFFPTWLHATLPVKVVAEYSTGIDNQVSDNMTIAPNPVEDMLHINGVNVNNIVVLNLNGVVVKKNNFNNSIDLSDLNAGMYIVRVNTEHGVQTRTIVKK